MEPTPELIREIERSKIEQAREMSEEEKLRAGVRMFARVRRLMLSGIRADFPDADEAAVESIFRQRLALSRRLDETC